jgi:Spy/CpxP family protein refolding chaperone
MAQSKRIGGLLAVCTALVLMAQGALAEVGDGPRGGRGPEGKPAMKRGNLSEPESRLKLLTEVLKLTEEQQAKIKPILAEEFTQLEAIRGNDTLNRDERNTRLQAMVQTVSDKIKPILTPEQQAQYEQIKQEIRERRLQNKGSRPVPPLGARDVDRRLNRLTRDLTLTKEQQAKIRPILEEEATQLDALRGNDTLSRDERRARLQALNQAAAEKITPLLTPAQQKKYAEVKQLISDLRSQKKMSRPTPAAKP